MVRRAKRPMKFEEQCAIAVKTNIGNFRSKKIVETNKRVREKRSINKINRMMNVH